MGLNLVLDCDEVLTNVSPLWSYLVHKNAEYFGKYFDIKPDFDLEKDSHLILMRNKFYLNEFFLKEGITMTEEEQKELYNNFMSLYDNEEFYKYCKPTKFAKAIADISVTNYISKIFIVSRCTENNINSKKELIYKIFKDCKNKVEFVVVKKDEKKSDVINKLGKIDLFVDDELSNVIDVIKNVDQPFDIYIPKLGYNKPTKELKEAYDNSNKNVMYYNAF